jgi:hypothetical protein
VITRNEQVSGSSPLVGSLYSPYLSRILGKDRAQVHHRWHFDATLTPPRSGIEWQL